MSSIDPNPPRGRRVADRLASLRAARFIGRRAEMELFGSALAAEPPPFTVLYVHGPGGVGKTTLLHACASAAIDAGRPVVAIDGRHVQPTREAFTAALAEAAGIRDSRAAAALPERAVLVVDTCELLAPLDAWLRHTFLPQLPLNAIVVLAGRNRPAPEWRTDLAWAPLTRIVELRNFGTADAIAFLQARGVSAAAHAPVLRFTHGHPLALTLAADALAARPEAVALDPGEVPDVVRQLLAAIVDRMPAGAERDALEISACARVTTEPLLADLLGPEDGRRAYRWLQGQSFVEHTARGVFPHDLAREVLLAEARWRDEPRLRGLSRRVYAAVHARIPAARGPERQQLQMDALYITRTQPTHRPFFDWTAMDGRVDAASPQDGDWIADVVRRHEGTASAAIAGAWWGAQPAAFHLLRDARDERFGFLALLELASGAAPAVRGDPAASAAMRFVERHRPLARGDSIVYLRWWMHAERYQAVTAAINLTATHVVSQCTTRPDIAWNFVAMADPAFWAPPFEGVNFARVPDADFEVGGRRFGVFAHDWRFEPAAAWVSGERTPMPFAPSAPGVPPAALDEGAFREAVRLALREYARPEAPGRSSLLDARVVRTGSAEPAAALRRLLRESAEGAQGAPARREVVSSRVAHLLRAAGDSGAGGGATRPAVQHVPPPSEASDRPHRRCDVAARAESEQLPVFRVSSPRGDTPARGFAFERGRSVMDLFDLGRLLHSVVGTIALAAFWTAALAAKGGRAHKRAGTVYLLALMGVLTCSTLMVAGRALRGDPAGGIFLAFLISLVGAASWLMWFSVRYRRTPERLVGSVYRAFATWLLLTGTAMFSMGAWRREPLMMFLSLVGAGFGANMWRLAASHRRDARWWLAQHMNGAALDFIATHDSFIALGLGSVIPEIRHSVPRMLVAAGVTAAGIALRIWLGRKHLDAPRTAVGAPPRAALSRLQN